MKIEMSKDERALRTAIIELKVKLGKAEVARIIVSELHEITEAR